MNKFGDSQVGNRVDSTEGHVGIRHGIAEVLARKQAERNSVQALYDTMVGLSTQQPLAVTVYADCAKLIAQYLTEIDVFMEGLRAMQGKKEEANQDGET